MLSIGTMGKGQERYYLDLAREDYYLEGGEPPGRWWGRGAGLLGLKTVVEREDLSRLFQGFGPGGKPLVQNAGKDNRQCGWDLTFSAPKSVSVLWSQADQETRRIIQEAQHSAVQAALSYLQSEASFSRIGKGGMEHVRAGLVVATFEHGTSRALDPQLHTHCLVLNVGTRNDPKNKLDTGTILSRPFYRHKMTAGVMYRVQLAYELERRLGVECVRDGDCFSLSGVPKPVLEHFSKRRAEIERVLEAHNMESSSAAAFASLSTRKVKDIVPPRSELFHDWQEEVNEHGFGPDAVNRVINRPRLSRDQTETFAQALNESIEKLIETQSHFAARELLRFTAQAMQGAGMNAATVQELTDRVLATSSTFVALGTSRGEQRYTTREMLDVEAQLLHDVGLSKSNHSHMIDPKHVDRVLTKYAGRRSAIVEEAKYHASQVVRAATGKRTKHIERSHVIGDTRHTLSEEQKNAVRHLTQNTGGVQVLSGMAGTGKTTTLRACREVWENADYRVLGVSLAGKAARELQKGSGIKSTTIATLELLMDPQLDLYKLKQHGKHALRTVVGLPSWKPTPFRIDAKTVLVVDEAGMVGTRLMARLVEAVTKGGGKLVLVGDARQLQPIEAGGPFATVAKTLGQAELKKISRQQDWKDRQVVYDAADGKAESALKSLGERGLLHVADNRSNAMEKLVANWAAREAKDPKNGLIFCGRNEEAIDLNRRCQKERIRAGLIEQRHQIQIGEEHIHVGDRVQLLKNSTKLDVRNGDIATVIGVNALRNTVTVTSDEGGRVVIPLSKYKIQEGEHRGEVAVRLGYAVTSHKGQGTTVDRAYVLMGGAMQDREISYVQLSRSRQETKVYVDKFEAGTDLADLARKMSQSRAKGLAHAVLEESRQRSGPSLELRYSR